MKNLKSKFLNYVSAVVIIVISGGCNDSNTPVNTSDKITVNGIITNFANQAISNIKVKIGNDSAVTSAEGIFRFNNVSSPYDLLIIGDIENLSRYYSGLTAENLRISEIGYIDDSLSCNISVTYPSEIFKPGVSGKIIFSDGKYVNAYGELNETFPLSVRLSDNLPVTGKLILITYKKDASGKIISYENFGQSDQLTVTAGGEYSYDFTMDELSLNPGEETISGIINLQPGFSAQRYFYLSFSDKRTHNYIPVTQFEIIDENNFNLKIPTGLPVQFSSMLGCDSYQSQLRALDLFKLPPVQSGIVLETNSAPELLTPEDNAVNVDTTTLFSFTPGTGTGIYRILFSVSLQNEPYIIYTSRNSFYLSEFKGLFKNGLPQNTDFIWVVEKNGIANSINEYVTTYTDRQDYFRNNSGLRHFTTGK